MNAIVPFEPTYSWGTRNELQFLECLWQGRLDYPIGGTVIDQMSALRGYAEGFRLRRNWRGIDPKVILRWLEAHSLLRG